MANKKITDATTATSVAGTDKVFLNQGGDLKQVDLNSAVANSQVVQTLNSNLSIKTLSLSLVADNATGTITGIQIGKIVVINLWRVAINKQGTQIEIARNVPKSKQRTFSVLSCENNTNSILLYHLITDYSILAVTNVGNIGDNYFGQIVYVTD